MKHAGTAAPGFDPLALPPSGGAITAKILVADDDPNNLFAVEQMLQGPGIELVLARSGEDVLRHVLKEDFAVILLDVRMPRMDGYEVATLLRNRPRTSRVPILFLTAYNKEELHVFRGYTAGAVDYVFKPIEPLILRSKVDVFVELYRKTEEIRLKAEHERSLLLENLKVRGEKLAAERALRRREEHQALVLRSLPIALYTASVQEDLRALRFTNESIERITGFPCERFVEEPGFWEERLEPEDRERVLRELGDTGASGSVALEYRWRCADGSQRYILDQVLLIRDEEGAPREFFGMWLDITDRKHLEQSLLHASKLEAVGQLTGGIAHDFNNMLSVVVGNLDLLQGAVKGNERACRQARLAMDGAQRCADLTSRLLAFSRRQPLQTRTVDLRDLVGGMLELLQRTLGERIEVTLDADEDLWPVEVDASQLEAAIVNLAVNARDAMPTGGRLGIALRNSPACGDKAAADRVEIVVTDTGSGMPPAVLERVFEPFFTTKESGKGTGLGLSMVYGFVHQSNGDIAIASVPDQGTTVTMKLPRAAARAAERIARETGPTPVTVEGRGATVLVVEDDPKVRQVAVSTLESLGFSVREAENGEEAALVLKQDSGIALVLSDVRMPGTLTGIELGRMVKRDRPEVGVLLTSGYVDEDADISGFDFLQKPYRSADLAEKLRGLMNQAPPVRESAGPAAAA